MTSDTKSHLSVDTNSKVLFLSNEYVSTSGDSDRSDKRAARTSVPFVTVTEGESGLQRDAGEGGGKCRRDATRRPGANSFSQRRELGGGWGGGEIWADQIERISDVGNMLREVRGIVAAARGCR